MRNTGNGLTRTIDKTGPDTNLFRTIALQDSYFTRFNFQDYRMRKIVQGNSFRFGQEKPIPCLSGYFDNRNRIVRDNPRLRHEGINRKAGEQK